MNGEYDWFEGYFATRHRQYKIDVPVRVWLEDGDRDEFGELESDQIWRAVWFPNPRNKRGFPLSMSPQLWIYLRPISEGEFEWLMSLKR